MAISDQNFQFSDFESSEWIWSAESQGENQYVFFRREFDSSGGRLEIQISADSFYWLYVDGEWIGRGPARSPLSAYTFDRFESPVGPGPHCVGVLGHHVGKVNATIMTGRPGVIVDAVLHDSSGRTPLGSSPNWKCLAATAWKKDLPDLMSHFGFWEERDERLMPVDWSLAGFDDSSWTPALGIGRPPCEPWKHLHPRPIALPEYRTFQPHTDIVTGNWNPGPQSDFPSKTVTARTRNTCGDTSKLPWTGTANGEGAWLVFDFERCLSGYVELVFSASAAGQCLEISYDDLLAPGGFLNPERSYAHLTDRYFLPGGACRIRTAHPRGFRYVMLDLDQPDAACLEEVSAIDETYPFRLHSYDFGDAWLQQVYEKSADTLRVCTTDAFTDCASRERVQWTQDLYLANRVAFYAFDDTTMMRNAVFQAAQTALPDGRINGFFPSERTNCAFASSSLLWLHQVIDYWEFTGSDEIDAWIPVVNRLLGFLKSLTRDDGLIASWPAGQFWDWAPLEDTGCLLITNAVFIRALERLRTHPVFRDRVDFCGIHAVHALRAAAHEAFWDSNRELYRNAEKSSDVPSIYSQHANTMAVWSGICPADQTHTLLHRVIDASKLGDVPVGEALLDRKNPPAPDRMVPFGTLWFAHFLVETLFEAGMQTEALEQIHHYWKPYDHLPNYPETRIQHGNTTLCHAWAAGPAYLLPKFLTPARQSNLPL